MAQPNSAASALATAADYADAMMIARRAKTWLFVILLLMLLAQLAIFFAARYAHGIVPPPPTAQPAQSVQPIAATQAVPLETADASPLAAVLEYLTGIIDYLGMTLVVVLAVVLLLIVMIMLVGRLIGVSNVTSAFIWCIVFGVLLFPWQAFLNFPHLAGAPFRLPGVLYTWAELVREVHFDPADWAERLLKWARFVVFPLFAMAILLAIQVKSNRGLKLALGEAEPPSPPPDEDQSRP